MHISIAHLIAQGKSEERLQIHVLEPSNLGNFTISDEYGHSLTFRDQKVQKGDKIILYTGQGVDYSIPPEEGEEITETIYVSYWDIDTSSWNTDADTLSITDGDDIDTYMLEELLYVPPLLE